jgi:hypothetical protein
MAVRVDKDEHIFLAINRHIFLLRGLRICRNRLFQSRALGEQLFVSNSTVYECFFAFLRKRLRSVSAGFIANGKSLPQVLQE